MSQLKNYSRVPGSCRPNADGRLWRFRPELRLVFKVFHREFVYFRIRHRCGHAGKLVLCDMCPRSWHLKCAHLRKVPEGTWQCPSCLSKNSGGTADTSVHTLSTLALQSGPRVATATEVHNKVSLMLLLQLLELWVSVKHR